MKRQDRKTSSFRLHDSTPTPFLPLCCRLVAKLLPNGWAQDLSQVLLPPECLWDASRMPNGSGSRRARPLLPLERLYDAAKMPNESDARLASYPGPPRPPSLPLPSPPQLAPHRRQSGTAQPHSAVPARPGLDDFVVTRESFALDTCDVSVTWGGQKMEGFAPS